MINKQMAYVTFAISFVTMKNFFLYQLLKKDLNSYLSDRSNIANIWLRVI